ncbi:hypothetical protein [Chitinophaga sp. 212800010-3]|uniref:hypothetical protein n=1 Tax=Chitinophaga sp. 212800010-3 TaxID=3101735 RepID=UPI002E159334
MKSTTRLSWVAGVMLLAISCRQNELEKISKRGDLSLASTVTAPLPFSTNLLFDQQGHSQFKADVAANNGVQNLYDTASNAALSYTPTGYSSIYSVSGAAAAAGADGNRLMALAFKSEATDDSVARQPYLDKAAQILKAWAKVNVQSWHRPTETGFLPFYEAYSVVRSSFRQTDRDTVDGWILRRATVGAYNMTLQDGNTVNQVNNWEAIRICFLFYSAYILSDNSLLSTAKSSYSTFLDNYLLSGGKTTDFVDRDAVIYLQYGLQYVAFTLRAVYSMEGNTAGNTLRDKTNKIGLKLGNAISFWETFLCGLYHMDFANSMFTSERTTRLARYNPTGGVYALDVWLKPYPNQLYPYIKMLDASNAGRFKNFTRYVSLLNTPNTVTTPDTLRVQVYQNCQYGGYMVALAIGGYPTGVFPTIGIKPNDLSSVKTPAGRLAILYNSNFADSTAGGKNYTVSASTPCLVGTFNDMTNSIIVTNTY